MSLISASEFDFTGQRMPAEWEPHEATWLVWPSNLETWPEHLPEVQEIWLRMIEVLSHGEKVFLLVNDEETRLSVQARIAKTPANPSNVQIEIVANNDSWVRDSGPIFTLCEKGPGPRRVANDFIFNTWGKKYGPWDHDDLIPRQAQRLADCPVIAHDLVLEGGSIDVDGLGTLLTTRQCLLNKNRNPHLGETEIADRLKKILGVRQIVWLGDGIEGDDTDGHVDDITRFVSPGAIVTVTEPDTSDANHAPLRENLEHLRTLKDLRGEPFRIVELPMPDRVEGPFGRSPASYANFYISNQAVLVPVYSSKSDQKALEIIQDLFPKRKVVGIECTPLVAGLGSIHCVTQQQPQAI